MSIRILAGDCRATLPTLPDNSVHCCVTSPPYFRLRSYLPEGHPDKHLELGQEETPDEFITAMVGVFREVRRVLRDDGTLWLNIGDTYARNPSKGGSGPGGKNEAAWGYGTAQSAKVGSSDGYTRRADRPGGRVACNGIKEKDLIGIPWMLAFALRADGWYLRQDIIWLKPNPMPESVTDRCTKAHEYLFLLSKGPRYYYDADAIAEPAAQPLGLPKLTGQHKADAGGATTNGHGNSTLGSNQGAATRNKRSVWEVATQPYKEAHFATFPPALIKPCILAGSPAGGTVLDPFGGSGTTGMVCDRLQRDAILCELHPDYPEMARSRIVADAGLFGEVA